MNKLIAFMAVTAAVADNLLGMLLCVLGWHDWRAVYPKLGIFARFDECSRCPEKRNFIKRV